LNIEVMKPPGAEVDLLGPRLEGIAEPADDRDVGVEIFGDLVLLLEPVAGLRLPPP
jgi:hypothetical protein